MTQADSVLSTPPTNTPVDTTRRRFMTIAAGGITGLTPAIAAALPIDAATDSVFELIDTHRKAHAAHMASLELQNRFERRYGAGHGSWISTKPCHDENEAFEALIAAAATTLPSLLAKLNYMEELSSEFETEWMIEERPDPGALFRSFAESIANVLAVQS
jgi:hypothetical protein